MNRGWYLRFTVIVGTIIIALGSLWPNVNQWLPAPQWVQDTFSGRISPGLDIRGGMRLMYEVDVDEAIVHRRNRSEANLLERIGIELEIIDDDDTPTNSELDLVRERVSTERVGERRIRVTFENADDLGSINRDFLRERFADLREVERVGQSVLLGLRQDQLESLRDTAVEQTVLTIRNRIDALEIKEATVIGRDTDVIVEVPGATEEEFDFVRDVIARTARLEFKIVADDESQEVLGGLQLPEGIERQTETVSAGEEAPAVASAYLVARGEGSRVALSEYVEGLELPAGRQLAISQLDRREDENAGDNPADQEAWRTYLLHDTADVTGEDVTDAFVSFDQQQGGKPYVAVNFGSRGAERFGELTGRNVKRRMAVVLDDRVESAPVIQTEIGGGRCQITLGTYGTQQQILGEAESLVVVLRAGALPAPIRPANEQMIGPTLGGDSVAKGAFGALMGITAVLIFMVIYYSVAGIVADLMVILNVLFLLAALSALGATLTLPGLAGIALTVGMAVDANVLITERIREELRLGKSPRSAVEQGFARAFWSVMDAQLTTFIAGVVLFQFGTGPIKGFAVTLMLGIVTSLFTGIFCSRVCFEWLVRGLRVERLKVG